MANVGKGILLLAAMIGCQGPPTDATQHVTPVSPAATARELASAFSRGRFTYKEYKAGASLLKPNGVVHFLDEDVVAFRNNRFGHCFPIDNSRGYLRGDKARHEVDELECLADGSKLTLDDFVNAFGKIYFVSRPPDLTGNLEASEDVRVPAGHQAFRLGFERNPVKNVSMVIWVVSPVDIRKVASQYPSYPVLSEPVLRQTASVVTVARIRFHRLD